MELDRETVGMGIAVVTAGAALLLPVSLRAKAALLLAALVLATALWVLETGE